MAIQFTKTQIVTAIVKYIIQHGPVTHTAIETRAQSMSWYTMDRFDKVIETIHRHPQISSSVRDDDVYYKKKATRASKPKDVGYLDWKNRPGNYPEADEMIGIHPVFEEGDKMCNCIHHLSRDEILEYRKRKAHHRYCNKDSERAKVISNLYNKYYGRESDPDENNQTAPEQGSLLLETK